MKASVIIDFDKTTGKMKPMNAVNNGPVRQLSVDNQRRDNFLSYKQACFPYARLHDSSYCAVYGGEHIVDVHAIFPDFNANPYNPDSYDFTLTDQYVKNIYDAGTKVFYRLGSKIEHSSKKYGTIVPADFRKWAVICEHIIRHYNEGWADGFNYGIEYWEIWNEPDGVKANGDQPNWSGTEMDFFELYEVSATYLKSRFPHLKIGGVGFSGFYNVEWFDRFMQYITRDGKRVPMDFFSWHTYGAAPEKVVSRAYYARECLDKYGYPDAESICDEWNFVLGWGKEWADSIMGMIGMRGAAYVSATMSACQYAPLDMLMYYDARYGTTMNGLWDFYTHQPFKCYYAMKAFSEVAKNQQACQCNCDCQDVYCVASSGEGKAAIITYYCTAENAGDKEISVFVGENSPKEWTVSYLDKDRTMEQATVTAQGGEIRLTLPPDCVALIKNG